MVRKVAVCPSRGWVELVVTVGPAAGRGRGRRPVQPLLTDLLLPRVRIVRCRRDRMEHFVVSMQVAPGSRGWSARTSQSNLIVPS